MKKILFLVVVLITSILNAQQEELFAKANGLYNDKQYEEAIKTYESIIIDGKESLALYYNLANAHYKVNNIGESIYYYEKALALSPNDEDVKNNIVFAQNATIDQIDILPESIVTKTVNGIINLLSFDGWAWLSIIAVFIVAISFVLYYTAQITTKKRLFFISMFASVIVAVASLAFAFSQYNYTNNNQFAVVMNEKSSIKSEPNLSSEVVFELHEGTKVKVTETLENWKKIRLADGKIGWIPTSDIKEL